MRTARIIHIIRQIGSLAVTAVTAASTLNAYRPLARSGYMSLVSWSFGLVVTEFPLQTLSVEAAFTAVTANDPICRVTWMIRAVRMRSPYEAIKPCGRRPVISRLSNV